MEILEGDASSISWESGSGKICVRSISSPSTETITENASWTAGWITQSFRALGEANAPMGKIVVA